MTYKPKKKPIKRGYKPKPKALWFRAKYGDEPKPKTRCRIRPVSKRMAKRKREYNAKAKAFLKGKVCACWTFYCEKSLAFVCGTPRMHDATEVHHMRGRAGSLLMDERHWLPTCSHGHQFIHANPEAARKANWLCEKGNWNKPAPMEVA